MFRKVLIANRGAIACRIIRTLRRLNVASVAVYSDVDRHALHVAQADEAVLIGPVPAAQSYLNPLTIIAAARHTAAEAIHPGYGFLSENADFAAACEDAGLTFLGPTPSQLRTFGLKHTARDIARRAGVPLLPGSGLLADALQAVAAAARCGYPVILKSTAGGGGIGMRVCHSPQELAEHFAVVARLGAAHFGQAGVYLERFITRAPRRGATLRRWRRAGYRAWRAGLFGTAAPSEGHRRNSRTWILAGGSESAVGRRSASGPGRPL